MSHHSKAGKIGAHSRWAKTPDRVAALAPAREAFRNRFIRQVREQFPDLTDETVIAQLAESARKAHFARLQMLSAAARAKKKRAA